MKKKFKWAADAAMRRALNDLARRRKHFDRAGKALVTACDGGIFPADIYFIAACNRALQNFDAFGMAMKADYFSTAMILLRVQLDSVLRCFGITQTNDPHETAQEVAQGKKLDKLKDKRGENLRDARIVQLAIEHAEANKDLKGLYEVASGYVHLSSYAFDHLLKKTRPTLVGMQQEIFIGSTEPDVSMSEKLQLVQNFGNITNAWVELALSWATERKQFGSVDDLKKKYGSNA